MKRNELSQENYKIVVFIEKWSKLSGKCVHLIVSDVSPDDEVTQGINAATMRVSGLEKMC